jgi:hypothetical protein
MFFSIFIITLASSCMTRYQQNYNSQAKINEIPITVIKTIPSELKAFQSPLKECNGDNYESWTDCVGAVNIPDRNNAVVGFTGIYYGEWKNGVPDGNGIKLFPYWENATYIGEFKNWSPNGKGKYDSKSDGLFDGNFINFIKHGYFILTKDKKQYTAEYNNGTLIGGTLFQKENLAAGERKKSRDKASQERAMEEIKQENDNKNTRTNIIKTSSLEILFKCYDSNAANNLILAFNSGQKGLYAQMIETYSRDCTSSNEIMSSNVLNANNTEIVGWAGNNAILKAKLGRLTFGILARR